MKFSFLLWMLFQGFAYPCVLNQNVDFNFVASSAVPFAKLMQQSMDIMDVSMSRVSLNSAPERAFLQMMIAHHQGAINMANTIIAHSKDERLRNFAISIVMAQRNEIEFMKLLVNKFAK